MPLAFPEDRPLYRIRGEVLLLHTQEGYHCHGERQGLPGYVWRGTCGLGTQPGLLTQPPWDPLMPELPNCLK